MKDIDIIFLPKGFSYFNLFSGYSFPKAVSRGGGTKFGYVHSCKNVPVAHIYIKVKLCISVVSFFRRR
jgi:hypothetical protein